MEDQIVNLKNQAKDLADLLNLKGIFVEANAIHAAIARILACCTIKQRARIKTMIKNCECYDSKSKNPTGKYVKKTQLNRGLAKKYTLPCKI